MIFLEQINSNLSRDYKKYPIQPKEILDKNDFIYLYGTLNLTKQQVADIIGCKPRTINKFITHYNIHKTPQQLKECRERTNIERYGTPHATQNKQIKQKISNTLNNLPLSEKQRISNICSEKAQQQWNNYTQVQLQNIKNQRVQIWQNRTQEQRQTIKNKIKSVWENKTEEQKQQFRQKLKEINNTPYSKKQKSLNMLNVWNQRTQEQIKDFADKHKINWHNKSVEEQLELIQKTANTKTKNNTWCSSKCENIIYNRLKSKYKNVKTQYISDLYPFHCDFYIPDLNLYIEYQGHWSHGGKPFDCLDKHCIQILEKWTLKNSKAYKNSINTWTQRDPLKREIARKNNLNWIEFFNLKQFNSWFETESK